MKIGNDEGTGDVRESTSRYNIERWKKVRASLLPPPNHKKHAHSKNIQLKIQRKRLYNAQERSERKTWRNMRHTLRSLFEDEKTIKIEPVKEAKMTIPKIIEQHGDLQYFPLSDARRANISAGLKRYHATHKTPPCSEEHKLAISRKLKGRVFSVETIEKMRKSASRPRPDIAKALTGKHLSEAHRANIGADVHRFFEEGGKRLPISEEGKQHISEAMKGKPLSATHRLHLTKAWRLAQSSISRA